MCYVLQESSFLEDYLLLLQVFFFLVLHRFRLSPFSSDFFHFVQKQANKLTCCIFIVLKPDWHVYDKAIVCLHT